MRRTAFHPLRVVSVESLTNDAAAVTFAVPDDLAAEFAFAPGQSLTLKVGAERRSYSICSSLGRALKIGVREVPGGAVSHRLVRDLRPGDVVEVQRPAGSFTPDLATPGHHALIAAGSGITPILSIAASVLESSRESRITLFYGNRRADSVMFAEDIADLKNAHPARLQLVRVLSREPQEVELFNGRLDAVKLNELLPITLDVAGVDAWWLCGPFAMLTEAIGVLTALGVPPERVHRELFYVGDEPPEATLHLDPATGTGAEISVILEGRTTTVTVAPGVAVLDAAQKMRPDLPFACKGGVCGTCRARVTAGEVQMRRNYALEPAEVEAGFVLTCQAVPITPTATVDFDT